MLNPEVAQARLKQVYDKNWRSLRLQHIADLPDSIRPIAYGLLGCDAEGHSSTDYQLVYQYQQTALQQLDSVDDLTPIFDGLFPQFGAIVADGLASSYSTALPIGL